MRELNIVHGTGKSREAKTMAAGKQESGAGDGHSEEERVLRSTGADRLPDGRRGLRIKGWVIESCNASILRSLAREEWVEKLGTSHLPEMVFGESFLSLFHEKSGIKLHFNAFDALEGWKRESLPPVEVPAAAKWKFRSNPSQQVILDYDYTFTTPYLGSEMIERHFESATEDMNYRLRWENCDQQLDLNAPALRETILFYDEVVLYEDELADNGVSLLTVKVRVMPSCWFLLLRFWLRVDGAIMRLRDTRMYCAFGNDQNAKPVVLRESMRREATFQSLSMTGLPADSAAFSDPSQICERLPVVSHETEKLVF